MTDPRVLKAPLPRPLIVVMGLSPAVLGVLAVLDHSPARRLIVWTALAMALLWGLCVLWGSQRAIVLGDDQLTTRWVRRRRVPRSDIEHVEVASAGVGEHPILVHAGGKRTPLILIASHTDTARVLAEIRQWSGTSEHPAPPALLDGAQETSWREPVPKQVKWVLAACVALVVTVPLSLMWHPVPWWGWPAAAGLALMLARPAQALRGGSVLLDGDELVLRRRREVRVRAIDIIRVVTVSEQDERHSLIEIRDRRPLQLSAGDHLDERSAAIQRWAQQHGGGAGSDLPFREPRGASDLAFQFLMMLCMAASLAACVPRPGAVLGGAAAPFIMSLAQFFQPTTVVRDWSLPGD